MMFEPPPANDFERFYSTYFDRCRSACPHIKVIAAKWTFEDLIPGLSDFDTRFIVDDSTMPDDWHEISLQVGRVHTELAREEPSWARILEHLPGLNLTVTEIADPRFYYPEFNQWTFYDGDEAAIARIESYLDSVSWSRRDELFHLKKIATYFGPYQRGIDPPVNMNKWESKYPLHSRYMHYFTPPVQSAVSLAGKRNVRGKFEALRLARQLFDKPEVIDMVLDCTAAHYERAEDYEEPRLTEIERQLEDYLCGMWVSLAEHVSLLQVEANDTRRTIGDKIAAIEVDPIEAFYEGVKFSRLMKGRLLFWAEEILWFDPTCPIRIELNRIVTNFHDKPLVNYGRIRYGQTLEPAEVIERLRGELLSDADCEGISEFVHRASTPVEAGGERERARQVADVYEPVLSTLERIGADLLRNDYG